MTRIYTGVFQTCVMEAVKRFWDKVFGKPWLAGLIFALLFLACWYMAPFLRLDKICGFVKNTAGDKLAGFVFIFVTLFAAGVSMLLQFAVVYKLSEQRFKPLVCAALMLVCLAGLAVIIVLIRNKVLSWPPESTYFQQLRAVIENIGIIRNSYMGVYSLFIIVLAGGFGYLLSFVVREKNILLPIMLCCAIIDVWTVFGGVVNKVMTKAPAVLGAVSSSVPAVGTGKFSIISTIGAGDFIFPAMFFACVFRFGFAPRKNFWIMFAFLYGAMLLILTGLLHKLPALVPVCAAAICANYKEFSLSRKEWAYMGVVFAVLIIVLYVFKLLLK